MTRAHSLVPQTRPADDILTRRSHESGVVHVRSRKTEGCCRKQVGSSLQMKSKTNSNPNPIKDVGIEEHKSVRCVFQFYLKFCVGSYKTSISSQKSTAWLRIVCACGKFTTTALKCPIFDKNNSTSRAHSCAMNTVIYLSLSVFSNLLF